MSNSTERAPGYLARKIYQSSHFDDSHRLVSPDWIENLKQIPADFDQENAFIVRDVNMIFPVNTNVKNESYQRTWPEANLYELNREILGERYLVEKYPTTNRLKTFVHRAFDMHKKETVYMKFLDPSDIDNQERHFRFEQALQREAKITARAFGAPTVIDMFLTNDFPSADQESHQANTCVPVFVMTNATVDVEAKLYNLICEGLPYQTSLWILSQTAKVLEKNYQRDIIHKDLKPDHILVFPDRVLIYDYGIGHNINIDPSPEKHFIGTPSYGAPEIMLGEESHQASRLSDNYSFGLISFEMLTGINPQYDETASQMDILRATVSGYTLINANRIIDEYTHNPETRLALKKVYGKMLSLYPPARYFCPLDFVDDLAAALDHETKSSV